MPLSVAKDLTSSHSERSEESDHASERTEESDHAPERSEESDHAPERSQESNNNHPSPRLPALSS